MSEKEPLTRCVFQRQNDKGDWVDFIEMGFYKLSELSLVIHRLIEIKGKNDQPE